MNQRTLERIQEAAKEYDKWPDSFKEAFRLSTIVDRVPPTLQQGVALVAKVDSLNEEIFALRSQLRELALNICSDSELSVEGEDGRYYALCVSSTYVNELCAIAGVGYYYQALDIIDGEKPTEGK